MPFSLINIVRELTDSAAMFRSKQVLCSDYDNAGDVNWIPNTDIIEDDEFVIIRAELAGVEKEDICIKIKNEKMQIVGIRKKAEISKKSQFHQMEIYSGKFEKIITLPESLIHNEVEAHFVNGLLIIQISKQQKVVEITLSNE